MALVVGCRTHAQLASVPIVLCSADTHYLRERAGESAAVADVHRLIKPFSVEDVQVLLDGLLSRSA